MAVLHTDLHTGTEPAGKQFDKGGSLSPTELPDSFFATDKVRQIISFHAPRFEELPNIELYRDQVITYIDDALAPLRDAEETWLTPSMVNNYTKLDLLPAPTKKTYSREHLSRLMCICMLKQLLPIPSIRQLMQIQTRTYDLDVAYDYFMTEFEHALQSVFTDSPIAPDTASRSTRETQLIRSTTYAIASKLFVQSYLCHID